MLAFQSIILVAISPWLLLIDLTQSRYTPRLLRICNSTRKKSVEMEKKYSAMKCFLSSHSLCRSVVVDLVCASNEWVLLWITHYKMLAPINIITHNHCHFAARCSPLLCCWLVLCMGWIGVNASDAHCTPHFILHIDTVPHSHGGWCVEFLVRCWYFISKNSIAKEIDRNTLESAKHYCDEMETH